MLRRGWGSARRQRGWGYCGGAERGGDAGGNHVADATGGGAFGGGGDVLLVVRREGVALRGGDRGDRGDLRLVLARYENRKFIGKGVLLDPRAS